MESMMTVRQVAELLGVHENWVYDQAASGELPSYKIGGTRRFIPRRSSAGSPSTARPSAASQPPRDRAEEAEPSESDEASGGRAAYAVRVGMATSRPTGSETGASATAPAGSAWTVA